MTSMLNLEAIEHELLDGRTKGFPYGTPPIRLADVGKQGWRLLDGTLPLPQAVIKDTALAHNHAWMRDFTSATGVLLAPHGKTTMAPQIFAQQLAAGAWGITVATVQQLALCVGFGIRRVIMANQLVGAHAVAEVIRLREQHPDLEFYFLIDSTAQLQLIEAQARKQQPSRRLTALLELGVVGGRTGCRTEEEALALAKAIAASTTVELAGIECYEGLQITGDSARDAAFVAGLMETVHRVALACDGARLFAGPSIILSAGGSAAFDIVARELPTRLSKPVQTILRSGCYVTHDSGFYARMLENVKVRSGAAWQARPGLRPALEVWAQVQSRPEPGLALLTMGKRDASFDLDLPHVQWHFRSGPDTLPQPAPAEWKISAMNDQHAYLRVPVEADLRVGDLIGSGISHPCTTFDKWRALFTVDDGYRVTGAILTFF
jgi:D-serine deaminase-like pyridoxal phosphate-dependent protein